ncbi:VOC family protein [Jeotgalibacillus proteolyticus]|uniref:VOC family protein n=1 Tax=Jeotgalibacillus proteolyticus TaxID=2082395 RepID=A0A2S5GBD0_9BACL|nr:VOC family protein [Jeotgalibacillus proteolyticus]PPA70347.1 VOC family protein [Jeotgalibacillus proteolyticus]
MNERLIRVGTTYLPVSNVEASVQWYVNKLGAKLTYQDMDKAILNLANQSFFLVKTEKKQNLNFYDANGDERFSLTFEVNGLHALEELHRDFKERQLNVGEIENRGHAGKNFVFRDPDGNLFDVWSELSEDFREKYSVGKPSDI